MVLSGWIAMRMVPACFFSWVAAFGRETVMPTSLMNTAVMMKKMRRFRTKSSIGARSMPVVETSSLWRCLRRRMSVGEAIRQELGLELGARVEVVDGIQAGDRHRQSHQRAGHCLRH